MDDVPRLDRIAQPPKDDDADAVTPDCALRPGIVRTAVTVG